MRIVGFERGENMQRSLGAEEVGVVNPNVWLSLRSAFYAFALSRILCMLAALLASAISTQWPAPQNDGETLRLITEDSAALLRTRVLANDAGWYLGIASEGYEKRPFDVSRQANWAFFPLHPWLWRVLIRLGIAPWLSGLVLANTMFLLALIQLHRWVCSLRGQNVADRAVLCVALFPTSYFFSLPWSESLFLLLSVSSFLALRSQRWWLAAVFGAFASATRLTGILIAPVIWFEANAHLGARSVKLWMATALVFLGLAAFMIVLWSDTGNALAFADIQQAWGRNGGSLTKWLYRWVSDPLLVAEFWNLRWINNGSFVLLLAASLWLWRRRFLGFSAFTALCALLPFGSGTLLSMGRYVLTCAPVFLALACWLEHPRVCLAWLIISSCLLVFMCSAFVLGATFAGA